MDLADVPLLWWRGSSSSCTLLLGLLHVLVMVTSHESGFLTNEAHAFLHQSDSLSGGHRVYVHCIIILLLVSYFLVLK